ncbi:MAG: glycoside hydrolase family 11 protein [Ruminococcus sp.]|uniref:glycoside hydrolase family 11 protein n=1 Tax=Ruminococcus sp. TaxID=41978 RepID=UPI0025CFF64E|nr:glycoside hydrolase family 11 protein [Ruminococcus sp.]MCR4793867.1 glycoside hydrolase family 11 protein [Ruminococcus sp.]
MNNTKKHFLSALTACLVTAASMTVFHIHAVGNTNMSAAEKQTVGLETEKEALTEHIIGPDNGENYNIWKGKDDNGELSLDLNNSDLSFECSWNGTKRAEYLIGKNDKINFDNYKRYSMEYSAEINCEDDYGFGASFVCSNEIESPQTEVRVLEAYSGEEYSSHEITQTIEVNGVSYNVYNCSLPCYGFELRTIYVLRSDKLAAEKKISGDIDIKGIFKALNMEGYKLHDTHTAIMYIEGLGEKGSIKVNRNNINIIQPPERITVPNSNSLDYVYYDGLRYSFWQDDSISNGKMTFNSDGSAECIYDNTNQYSDCLFKKGIIKEKGLTYDEYDNLSINYKTTIKAKDNYAAGVYGWLKNDFVEFYVVQFRNSDDFLGDAKYVETVTIDGVKYDIYKGYAMPLAFDAPLIERYWSVSQQVYSKNVYEGNGEVDLIKHFQAWEKAGLKRHTLYEVSSFAESFGKGKGEFILGDVDISIKSPQDKNDVILGIQDSKYEKEGYSYYPNDTCILKEDGTFIFSCDHAKPVCSTNRRTKVFPDGQKIYINKNDGLNIIYDADVSTECDYYINGNVYMATEDNYTNINLCIYDYSSQDRSISNAKKVGEFELYGVPYELYISNYINKEHTINGTYNTMTYYSVCKDKVKNHENIRSNIDVAAHAKAFKDAGYETGPVTGISLDVIFNGAGKGEVVYKNCDYEITKGEPQTVTQEDIELFQNFLLGKECDLAGKDFDLNNDFKWDIYDLIEMKKTVYGEL